MLRGWLTWAKQETKGRTLEEIGTIFGDEHVAAHWYGISEQEKEKIAQEAMNVTVDGEILDGHGPLEKNVHETTRVENRVEE